MIIIGKGNWKKTAVETESAGVSVKFFFSLDKNGAQIKKEVMAKKLASLVAPLLPNGTEVFINKRTGALLVNRRPIAQIVVPSEYSTTITWWPDRCIALELDTEEIECNYRMLESGWSSS